MQCRRTCRDCRPYEPETWCESCTHAEADDREANMLRWRASEEFARRQIARRAAVERWERRFDHTGPGATS